MGLPQIDIRFYTLGTSALKRSEKGVVALILKDNTNKTFETKIYKSLDEVDYIDWNETNLDYIKKTFKGIPAKVIVERLDEEEADYNKAFTRLKNKKFNYIAIPGANEEGMQALTTFTKTQRNEGRTIKAVVNNIDADCEGIINFVASDIKVADKLYQGTDYTCRIAGILAGLNMKRSSTYYHLDEVESVKEFDEPNKEIDEGRLILINDGEHVKIARGVNSLVSTTKEKGTKFKKIKIVEAVDQIKEDIYKVFDEEYVGKVNNSYDNKILFLSAINAYFKQLQRDEILDPNIEAKAVIDMQAHRIYIESKGLDVDTMDEQAIKEFNTESKIFLSAKGSPLDAMEDLSFGMLII